MVLEMELKYLAPDFDELQRRLIAGGGDTSGPYLESNLVFDDAELSLKDAGTLLRLREKKSQALLTVKKKPATPISSSLKVYEEIESTVGDFDAMKTALEAVGFSVAFGYEKVREKWRFMDCNICLDRLPYGEFVEIEGTEESVAKCASHLGLDEHETSKLTYHALNVQYRSDNGLEPDENFLFSPAERARIVRQLRKD